MASLISKASLLMVPSVYEDGTLYNVLPSGNKAPDETGNHNGYDQTRADFTFSRGFNLTATRVNANGLIEKGRENLLLQSNSFDESDWGKYNVSVTTGQADKDGGTTAFKITKTGVNGRVYQAITQTGINTASVFVKAGDSTFLRFYAAGPNANVYFDLSDGTFHSGSAYISYDIESVGNGWYRCSVTFDGAATIRIYPAEDNTTGGASGSIFIQDSQAEAGLVSTPVIRTGATTATAGVLENTPRIDYSSGAGALLLEPQRTNLAITSEYAGGSGWFISSGYSVSHNAAISPEGLQNAFELTIPSVNGNTRAIISVSPSTEYTFSFYVKRGTATELKYSIFNLTNNSNIIAQTSYYSQTSATEWKRIEVTFTTPAGCTSAGVYIDRDSQANGTAFFYGIQCEQGSYATSYVPTYGSAATRGADSCSVTGASDVIGQTEGTLFVEVSALADDATNRRITLSDGTATNRMYVSYKNYTNQIRVEVISAGVSVFDSTYSSSDITENSKIALAYKANDFAFYVDGTQVATDTSGAVPSSMSVFKFEDGAGGNNFFGNVKQSTLFDTRLTNSELATLTTL